MHNRTNTASGHRPVVCYRRSTAHKTTHPPPTNPPMQRKLALTLLVCLACIACCHAWKQIVVPEKPTVRFLSGPKAALSALTRSGGTRTQHAHAQLPPAFSAAVHVQRNYKPYQEYFRWFRDEVRSHRCFIVDSLARFLLVLTCATSARRTHRNCKRLAWTDWPKCTGRRSSTPSSTTTPSRRCLLSSTGARSPPASPRYVPALVCAHLHTRRSRSGERLTSCFLFIIGPWSSPPAAVRDAFRPFVAI